MTRHLTYATSCRTSDLITSVALLHNKTSVLLGFRLLAIVGERPMMAQLIVRRWLVFP
jgi:hypothetical protein